MCPTHHQHAKVFDSSNKKGPNVVSRTLAARLKPSVRCTGFFLGLAAVPGIEFARTLPWSRCDTSLGLMAH